MDKEPLLTLQGISKAFGGVQALKDVNLTVNKGEVHSVVGENGAGKSTMMKIIAGALQPDEGELQFDGQKALINSPQDSANLGITIVYQEPNIFTHLTVLENIFLGEEIVKRGGSLDWGKMYELAIEALKLVDLPKSILVKPMGSLSIGTQQLVLIARGLHKKSKLLILDEPTSILSQAESEKLFQIMRDYKSKGVSILYISHRIPEILNISDNITVLRDGQVTEHILPEDASEDKIIAAMSGREIDSNIYRPREFRNKEPLLVVKDLSRSGMFDRVSFQLRPREILGLYGLVGSGRSEMARAIFGELEPDKGEIVFAGKELGKHNIKDSVDMGIYYVPEDRGSQGIFPLRSVKDNLSAAFLNVVSFKTGVLDLKREYDIVKEQVNKYSIKMDSEKSLITSLSGGTQQKVVLARWLINTPKLLILDEPTRGIDVKTKTEIHEWVISLAEQGIAILLISSDLPEIINLSDNVLTMHKGTVTGFLARDEASEENILKSALGLVS